MVDRWRIGFEEPVVVSSLANVWRTISSQGPLGLGAADSEETPAVPWELERAGSGTAVLLEEGKLSGPRGEDLSNQQGAVPRDERDSRVQGSAGSNEWRGAQDGRGRGQ